MKKTIFATIIIALVAVFAVSNIAYSYFAANLNIFNNLNVGAIFTGNYTPAFTAVSEGDLQLAVTDADMISSDAEGNNIALTKIGNITVSLDAVGDEKGSTASCTFEFIFEDLANEEQSDYEKYIPSAGLADLDGAKEYTIEIKESNETILEETSVDKLMSGEISVDKSKLTITSSNTDTTKIYNVIARVYNLDIDQTDIKNKKYGFKIETKNIECTVS